MPSYATGAQWGNEGFISAARVAAVQDRMSCGMASARRPRCRVQSSSGCTGRAESSPRKSGGGDVVLDSDAACGCLRGPRGGGTALGERWDSAQKRSGGRLQTCTVITLTLSLSSRPIFPSTLTYPSPSADRRSLPPPLSPNVRLPQSQQRPGIQQCVACIPLRVRAVPADRFRLLIGHVPPLPYLTYPAVARRPMCI